MTGLGWAWAARKGGAVCPHEQGRASPELEAAVPGAPAAGSSAPLLETLR